MLKLFASTSSSGLLQKLKQVSLFSGLSSRELKVIAGLVHERQAVAGEVIFDQGEDGQAIYCVLEGQVAICQQGQLGKPIAVIGAGGIFGELALIDGGPRSAQARALTDCELGVMFRGDFANLMESHALIATRVSFQLARHYAGIIRRLAAGQSE